MRTETVERAFDAAGQQVAASIPILVQRGSGVHSLISVSTPTATIVGFEITGSPTREVSKHIAIDGRADVLQLAVPRPPPTLIADLTRYNLSSAGTGQLVPWSLQDVR